MPKKGSTLVLIACLVWLVGCRSDEPRDVTDQPASTEPSPTEPVPTAPQPTPVVDTRPWGADAEASAPAELPDDLAARTYDASVASIEIPKWELAVVEPGAGPRLLRYRTERVSRRVRYSIVDDDATLMTVTLHWWSLASSTPESLDFGFAGIDCEMPLHPALAERKEMAERWAATAKVLSAKCAEIRGQGRANGSRVIHMAQTAGPPMTPPVDHTLTLFSVPLPDEPIGIGGVWTATEVSEGVTSTSRYRLLAVEGAELTIEFVGKSTSPDAPDEDAKGTFVVSLFDPIARSADTEVITRIRHDPDSPVSEFLMRLQLATLEPQPASPK
jgi:hypothetical protein